MINTPNIRLFAQTHGEAEADGDDAKIIPRIVAQAVAPLARKIISLVWDPFSYKQTVSVIELIKELEVYLTEGSHMRVRNTSFCNLRYFPPN